MVVNLVWTQLRAATLRTKNPVMIRRINARRNGRW
jgi:hypothetical protein